MLAYLFWHRPREREPADRYEDAVRSFHRSLARSRPAGMIGSASYRLARTPWQAPRGPELGAPSYEDWYLLEDYASLGVLGEAAVGRGHRSSHDEAARRYGDGAGALYALLEGAPAAAVPALACETLAVWVSRSAASAGDPRSDALGELLGDGIEPGRASLWRRQLVLGPAPEYCLLASELPPGARPSRLPRGWSAQTLEREPLWSG